MPAYHAPFVFDGTRLHREATLVTTAEGVVESIRPGRLPGARPIEGILSPAFVNAHCHLELSYLKGRIPKHTGMAGFIETLQGIRGDTPDPERVAVLRTVLEDLESSGVGGIGDICNGPSSLDPKKERPGLHYRNFCEVFGLDPRRAEELLEQSLDLAAQFDAPAHPTLHAPYSMSPRLRDLVADHLRKREVPLSLHLLESAAERQLFEELAGPLFELFRKWGLVFSPHAYDSVLDYVLESLPRDISTLLVHCTEMTPAELDHIAGGWPRAFFVLCPRANDYIHGHLPDATQFARYPERICLGTDSLAGNDSLDMVAEMRLLQSEQGISTELLLRWATLNGAEALQFSPSSFRMAPGDRPILIQIAGVDGENAKFTPESQSTRLVAP